MRLTARLLASAAFANPPVSAGVKRRAALLQTPNPALLHEAAEAINAQTEDAEDLEKYATDMACNVEYWDKTDDIIEGQAAIIRAGEKYLPKFYNETADEYTSRQKFTKFTNIYRDIVESLASKPFEQEVAFAEPETVDEQFKLLAENIDGNGNNLTVFASLTFFNGINSAIDWIFIDYPEVDSSVVRTRAEEKAAGVRPFWTHVLGRNVREARTEIVGDRRVISYIRIFEPAAAGDMDHVRIFERDPAGVVTWRLYRKLKNTGQQKSKYALEREGTISIGIVPLVPFITGRRDGNSWKIWPAMQDAADLQIQLYQDESGLKWIKTLAGYPMLAANGMRPELEPDGKTPKKVAIGPARVLWGVPDGNGNHGEWKFVEPSATSMDFQQKSIDKTVEALRELGRQPLTANSGNLTVITTAYAAGKSKSTVSAWALGLKDALENAWKITGLWIKSAAAEAQISVYTDFDSFTDGTKDLDALGTARKNRDISGKTYTSELQRRNVLSPEYDYEKDQAELLKEIPSDAEDLDDDNPQPGPGNAPKLAA